MATTKEEILDAISEMSVMDVVDLVKLMEEKFGVTAAAPVAAAAAPAARPRASRRTKNGRSRCSFLKINAKNIKFGELTT